MAMTRKQRRSAFIVTALVVLGSAVGLVLFALEDTIVFFYTPTEVAEKNIAPGQRFRLGGLVADGSVIRGRSRRGLLSSRHGSLASHTPRVRPAIETGPHS